MFSAVTVFGCTAFCKNTLATGCSDPNSSAAAIFKLCCSSISVKVCKDSSTSRPLVKVPVLSKIIWVTLANVSRAWPRVVKTPKRVKLPVAAVMAAGVANDKAHGQVTTNKDKTIQKACSGSCCHHQNPTAVTRTSKKPTNQAATLSAVLAIPGFSVCARSSKR